MTTITEREPLTTRQREILGFIVVFMRRECRSPTFREMVNRFKFKSKNAITEHLRAIEKKGWISLVKIPECSRRSIKIIPEPGKCWCCEQKLRRFT